MPPRAPPVMRKDCTHRGIYRQAGKEKTAAGRFSLCIGRKTGRPARQRRRAPWRRSLLSGASFQLVPVTGLEPVRCRQRWILSPLRLPIPSHRRVLPVHYTVWRRRLQDKFTGQPPKTETPSWLSAPMMTPASSTPPIHAMTLRLKSMSSRLAASVPVHAPVPGSGMPTKRSSAQ